MIQQLHQWLARWNTIPSNSKAHTSGRTQTIPDKWIWWNGTPRSTHDWTKTQDHIPHSESPTRCGSPLMLDLRILNPHCGCIFWEGCIAWRSSHCKHLPTAGIKADAILKSPIFGCVGKENRIRTLSTWLQISLPNKLMFCSSKEFHVFGGILPIYKGLLGSLTLHYLKI